MSATTTERKSLLPEIRVVGKRFIIEDKVANMPETPATPNLFNARAEREVEDPVVKTGLIPKHVWG